MMVYEKVTCKKPGVLEDSVKEIGYIDKNIKI